MPKLIDYNYENNRFSAKFARIFIIRSPKICLKTSESKRA